MQSAITELFGIVASASIHDGWYEPEVVTRTVGGKQQSMHVIKRTATSKAVGGHAFCIVGYNDVGFLVQNSWGTEWASKGFATLPYDDWLESGYDAWVARPGVPSIVSRRVRSKLLSQAGGGGLVEAPGPDLEQLTKHVVNLGNDGRLSQNGRFTSTKQQIDAIFDHMARRALDAGTPRPSGSCCTPMVGSTASKPASTSPNDRSTGGSATRSTRSPSRGRPGSPRPWRTSCPI